MSNQLLTKKIPNVILFSFLEKYATKKNNNCYIVTKGAFKRARFYNDIEIF